MLAFAMLAGAVFAAPPDLTNGGVPNDALNINLGPTGLRGWVYHVKVDTGESRQILVQAVDAGSPAAGVLAVNDVILGADGTGAEPVSFSSDARRGLAEAIHDSEARNPAALKLLRWRAGVTTTLTLTLRTMGAYTSTAPYNCPKSAKILEEGLQAIMAGETAGRYSLGTLALLAGNDPANPLNAARQARAQSEARALIPNAATLALLASGEPEQWTFAPWQRGHELIVLTEYYLQTNDVLVLPAIEAMTKGVIAGQNVFGTTGHKFAPKWRDGSPNGPLRSGYGAVNNASMPGFLGLLLAKECGVVNPDLDAAIARAGRFLAYYAGKGAIPYGEHEAYWQGHTSNGKSGLAALSFELMAARAPEQRFFARMTLAGTSEREIGHTGAFFNYLWEPLGAAAGGEQAAASYFSRARWMFDLCRRWDGSFVYDCLNGEGPNSGATYNDFRMSTAALLVYALPLRKLHLTGRGHDTARWLSTAEVAASAAADGYAAAARSTSQLVSDLGSWSPLVQRRAAEELKNRPTETTALLPALHAMANDSAGTSRVGACFALGYIGHASSGPVLAALLTDPVNHVRFAAAEGMRYLPQSTRQAHLNAILNATAGTAAPLTPFNEEDPLHMAHGRLGMLLFYSGSAYGPSGVLAGGISGVDRRLLYPAIRAVAGNPIGMIRSTLSSTYNNLTQADFLALADTVVDSAYSLTPADKMFSGADRIAALGSLEKFNYAEGVPLSVLTIEDGVGFNTEALAVLTSYAGGSTTVKPDPGVIAAMKFLIQTGVNPTEAQAVLNAIIADPNPAPLPPLKSLPSVNAGTPGLTLPSQWTVLRAASNDYAKGESVYTWRKVHGAGNVTFAPNGTGPAKVTTAYFDGTPGQYLFEVKMSDSKNLTEVYSTVAVTLKNSGGTLPLNYPPSAQAQSATIQRATPTPVTLTGGDPEGYALNFSVTSQPANGTLSGTAPYLIYTPAFSYTGADGFTFQVMDSEGQTASATVSLNVISGSGVPVAVYEPFNHTTGTLNGKGGSGEVGLGGTWFATSANAQIVTGSLTHGALPVSGNSFACTNVVNHFGGSRTVSTSALAANGLLSNGRTLWFSAVMGIQSTANATNSRLGFALANSRFSTSNFSYVIANEGPQLGSGLGVTLGRFDSLNGVAVATQFRDSTFGTSGSAGNVFGTVPPTFIAAGGQRLVVGRITWGASADTIELYEPDADLKLGTPTSTLTVNVDQSTYDTLTFAMSERVTLDEIRFGENFHSVLAGNAAMSADTSPPTPSPMSFTTPPSVIPGQSITMTATTAFDANGVEYFFTCTAGGGHSSGWQSSTTYTDTGLTPGVLYSYTVKTRDLSVAGNESTTSAAASATIPVSATVPAFQGMMQVSAQQILTELGLATGTVQTALSDAVPYGHIISQTPPSGQNLAAGSVVNFIVSAGENTPPAPNPAAFSTAPVMIGNDAVTMTAAPASDLNGVEYYFTCTAGDGHDSGWQPGRVYTDTGLTPGVLYSYTVKVRDLAPQQNTTAPSAPASVNAPALGYFWDGGSIDISSAGNGASAGGAGTWNASLLNWDIGAAPHIAWSTSSSETAVFGGTAGTIALGANISLGGLRFATTGYTLDTGSSALSFGSNASSIIFNGNSFAATITGTVGGTGNVSLTSGTANTTAQMSTLSLNGTSAGGWTGSTTLGRGAILSLASDTHQALGSTSGITLTGGQLLITNTAPTSVTNNRLNDSAAILGNGGSLIIRNTALAGNVYAETTGPVSIQAGYNAITLGTNQNLSGNNQTLTLGSLAQSGQGMACFNTSNFGSTNLIKVTGAVQTAAGRIIGPWALAGNGTTVNDYAVYNAAGAIVARAAANTAETSWPTTWADTANIAFNANPVTLSASRVFHTLRATGASTLDVADKILATYGFMSGGGSVTLQASANGGTGFITLPSNNGNGAFYLCGGNGAITVTAPFKDNGGTKLTLVISTAPNGSNVTLSGDNSHTGGTVISAPGTRNNANQDPGTVLVGHVNALGASSHFLQVDSGTLNLQGNAVTIGRLSGISGTITGTSTLTFGSGDATGGNFQGNLTSTLSLVKNGSGSQTLSGIHSATGPVTINAGTLQFAKTSALYNSATASWTAANLRVQSGGTLALSIGGAGEFTMAHITTLLTNLATSTSLINGMNTGSALAFDTTNATGGTFVIADAIADTTGASGGSRGLIKLGTGTLLLTGTSTYTGPTTVNGGALLINGSLHASSTVTVNAGTLGGDGIIGGSVTLSASASLAPGAATPGTLSLGGSLDLSAPASSGSGKLRFDLATPASSDQITLTGPLTIGSGVLGFNDFIFTPTAALTPGTYKLITSSGITGTLQSTNLSGPIGTVYGTLQITGGDLELLITHVPGSYAAWQAANSTASTFTADHDNDGVSNGIEYFLGSPAGPTTLPAITSSSGVLSITFTKVANYPGTYGTHFWIESAAALDGSWTPESPGLSITVNGNSFTYTFPASARRFARLKVMNP